MSYGQMYQDLSHKPKVKPHFVSTELVGEVIGDTSAKYIVSNFHG